MLACGDQVLIATLLFDPFDVCSSYYCEAEFAKRRIVHLGNVSWI